MSCETEPRKSVSSVYFFFSFSREGYSVALESSGLLYKTSLHIQNVLLSVYTYEALSINTVLSFAVTKNPTLWWRTILHFLSPSLHKGKPAKN